MPWAGLVHGDVRVSTWRASNTIPVMAKVDTASKKRKRHDESKEKTRYDRFACFCCYCETVEN